MVSAEYMRCALRSALCRSLCMKPGGRFASGTLSPEAVYGQRGEVGGVGGVGGEGRGGVGGKARGGKVDQGETSWQSTLLMGAKHDKGRNEGSEPAEEHCVG